MRCGFASCDHSTNVCSYSVGAGSGDVVTGVGLGLDTGLLGRAAWVELESTAVEQDVTRRPAVIAAKIRLIRVLPPLWVTSR